MVAMNAFIFFHFLLNYFENVQEVKPGLSSFAENPEEGGASIQKLINRALQVVPESHRSKTPVTLKATAGKK